jgi:hypothetical protein
MHAPPRKIAHIHVRRSHFRPQNVKTFATFCMVWSNNIHDHLFFLFRAKCSLGKRENFLGAVSISPCYRPVGPIAPRLTTQTYHKIIPSLGHTFGSTLRPVLTAIWSHRGQLMGSERPLWAHPEAQGPCCRPPAPPAVPTYQRRTRQKCPRPVCYFSARCENGQGFRKKGRNSTKEQEGDSS